jgi:hypothetical protein
MPERNARLWSLWLGGGRFERLKTAKLRKSAAKCDENRCLVACFSDKLTSLRGIFAKKGVFMLPKRSKSSVW